MLRNQMGFIGEYAEQLRETVRIQKDMLDGANKVIQMQQRQMDNLMHQVYRHLEIEPKESGEEVTEAV